MEAPLLKYNHIATDDTLRETIPHGSGKYPFSYYPEDVWAFDFHLVDWHWHHEVEFVTVKEGDLLCLIGEERIELSGGCGLFVNSGVLHRYEAVKGNVFTPNIVFSPVLLAAEESLIYEKYVLPVITSAIPYQIFSPKVEWQNHILEILSGVYGLQENGKCDRRWEERKGGDLRKGSQNDYLWGNSEESGLQENYTGNAREKELRTVRLLMQAWEILYEHWDMSPADSGIRHADHRMAKLQIMMQYVHDHYAEQITLEEIAAAASVSKSNALNIFQSGIHISPVSYLIQYRLKCASGLLYTTEKSITAIAEETGFSNAGYFCRKFKEHYHMTPDTYRKKRRGNL